MATIAREITNGEVIAAPPQEIEVRLSKTNPVATKVGFIVTSGAMQVTVARQDSQDVIDSTITAFGNTNYPIYMTIEPGSKEGGDGNNIFIKGAGTISFFW